MSGTHQYTWEKRQIDTPDANSHYYQFEFDLVERETRITIYVMAHLEAGYYP